MPFFASGGSDLVLLFRKRPLLILISALTLSLIIGLAAFIFCLQSEVCLLSLYRSFPSLGKFGGVQETNFAFRKGNFALSKDLSVLTVSGEIVAVGKDRLTLKFDDGSQGTFLVNPQSEFSVHPSLKTLHQEEGEEHVFNGSNLEDFISPGYYLALAPLENSKVSSEYTAGDLTRKTVIAVAKSP